MVEGFQRRIFCFIVKWYEILFSVFKPHSFPDSSVGKESACNSGDPGLIPGSQRSAGEEIGYPF